MARLRAHLAHAPITEALIDLQFPGKGIELAQLQDFAGSVEGYEINGPLIQIQTQWNISREDGARNTSVSQEIGFRLHSVDEKYVLQIRTEGFTLSRLEPYENWERLTAEARRLWEAFVSQVRPEFIRRAATRFINKLKLPMKPGEHFQDYLTKPPDVPDGLPQGVAGFTQRIVIVNEALKARANITQLLQEGFAPADHVPVVLDVDCYAIGSIPPESPEVWNLLNGLRVFKNEIFFANLTEKTVELFE